MCERHLTGYQALIARTYTIRRSISPAAYDCVKLMAVRSGSATLWSEFGERSISVGDMVLLGSNVLCGLCPERTVTVTTIYLDTDYVLDQLLWQYVGTLRDRLDVIPREVVNTI